MNAPASIVTKASLRNRQLPLEDIQGLILCDYNLPAVSHFFIRVDQPEGGRRLVGTLTHNPQSTLRVTTAADWTQKMPPTSALNIGFTYTGLQALHLPAATLASFAHDKAFVSSAAGRAARIGDDGACAPQHWRGQLNTKAVHVMVSLYADQRSLNSLNATLEDLIRQHSCTILHCEAGARLEDGSSQRESQPGVLIHFGYRDGIGQPVIAGAPRPQFAAATATVVPSGAFLLGYPSQWLGFQYPVPRPLEFGRNGSFAAFRILQQDVVGFEKYLDAIAAATTLDKELIAAKLCGRWRNGVPLVLSPNSPSPQPPLAPGKLNDFDFTKDPQGLVCPFDSHIRRTNPRGEAVAGADSDRHPIVRRGMPYGPKYDPRGKADDIERGLLGLFVCVSLEDQFEFLMTNWINRGGFRPELPSATQDLIAGNSAVGEAAFVIPGSSSTIATPKFSRFVTTKGGAYCFLPSITGLKYIAAL